jgi:hypothetical protein
MAERLYRGTFFDHYTSWRRVVNFTLLLLYPLGKSPRYPLDRRWTPEPVWTTWRINNSWPYRDSTSDPSLFQPVASRYTDCAIPVHQRKVPRQFKGQRFCKQLCRNKRQQEYCLLPYRCMFITSHCLRFAHYIHRTYSIGNLDFRNVDELLPHYTGLHPRWQ